MMMVLVEVMCLLLLDVEVMYWWGNVVVLWIEVKYCWWCGTGVNAVVVLVVAIWWGCR